MKNELGSLEKNLGQLRKDLASRQASHMESVLDRQEML